MATGRCASWLQPFSSTATKKTFDAVAASRRWRRVASRRLNKMTFAEQQGYLKQTIDGFFTEKTSRVAHETAQALSVGQRWTILEAVMKCQRRHENRDVMPV